MATNRSKNLEKQQVSLPQSLYVLTKDIQLAAAYLHLHLHGSTPLERLATPDDQSEVMSAELRVRVWSVLVRIPS